MNFCSRCGAAVGTTIPAGDHRERHVCKSCGSIFYENPKIVVGCVLEWEGRILLCRRAIEPRSGMWTLPAGFMENGESTAEGALRETSEEAGVNACLDGLFVMIDVPAISQVHLFFRGRTLSPDLAPGDETLEAGFFDERFIPWDELAFTSVELALTTYLSDRAAGTFRTHTAVLPFQSPRR